MKLLFLNSAYPEERLEVFKKEAKGTLQIPANTFQWAVLDGLEKNGVDYTLFSVPALPAWPHYKHLFTPCGNMKVNGHIKGRYLRLCNLPAVKQLHERLVLQRFARQWCKDNQNEDKICILTYTQQVEFLKAAINLKQRFPNIVVATIVTDLIENALDFASNKRPLKRVQVAIETREEKKLFSKVDKYILLSRYMTEYIPEADNRYIVIEGIAPKVSSVSYVVEKENEEKDIKTLLYTGALEKYAGVDDLIDAFRLTNNPKYRLIVCGSGPSASYIKQASAEDGRIVFKGRLSRDEAVRLQQTCTALINPRRPNGEITKYSFPSKTMEYMTSGTPMIGYHLEGIPDEYYEYMYTPVDLSVESLSRCIDTVLSLPFDERHSMADSASSFICDYKNPKVQVKKIIEFLND